MGAWGGTPLERGRRGWAYVPIGRTTLPEQLAPAKLTEVVPTMLEQGRELVNTLRREDLSADSMGLDIAGTASF